MLNISSAYFNVNFHFLFVFLLIFFFYNVSQKKVTILLQRVSIACYAERCISYDRFCPSDRLSHAALQIRKKGFRKGFQRVFWG